MRWLFALAGLTACACSDKDESPAPATGSAGSGSGSAVPVAAAPDAPVATGPCLPEDNLLYLVRGEPLRACAGDAQRCVTVAVANGAVAETAYVEQPPRLALPHASVEDHGGKWATCFDGTCKPLKRKARAALAKLQEQRAKTAPAPDAPEPTGTTDLAVVIIPTADGGVDVFDVKKDRPILDRGRMGLDTATAIGRALVTEWSPPLAVVYSSKGKELAELGPETVPGMIDDQRWLVVSRHRELVVFDGGPKQASRELDLDPKVDDGELSQVDFAVLPDKSLAILTASPSSTTIKHVDPARPAVIASWPIAVCGKK